MWRSALPCSWALPFSWAAADPVPPLLIPCRPHGGVTSLGSLPCRSAGPPLILEPNILANPMQAPWRRPLMWRPP